MMATLPKLRDDLIVRTRATRDGEKAVLKDPVAGEFYRFGEVELFILKQLDGETTPDEIRQRAATQFGASLDEETLTAFVERLRTTGLLDDGRTRERSHRRRRVQGNILYLRIPWFDPTRLFNRLLPWTRICFTQTFLVTTAVIISVAVSTLANHWPAFQDDAAQLYQFSSIPLFIAVVFVVIMAHEFAHGLTCRHFGGEVHEIGFLLMYFHPAFYCNVSDAWLFTERAKRLWVVLAGPYFELFLWALAVLVWWMTAGDVWIHDVALVAVITSGIKTLLNFNPLMKLDGYYLLSDALDVPNLRRRAYRYVGDGIKRLFGFGDDTARSSATRRERRIYLCYGLLATVYSGSVLGWLTLQLGDKLIDNSQPLALATFVFLLGAKYRRRLRRLFGFGSAGDDDDDDDDVPAASAVSKTSSKRSKSRRRYPRRWVAAGLAGVLLVVMIVGRRELRVSGPVSVLPLENSDVRAGVDGIVEQIFVDEGDSIKAGAPIARLSAVTLVAELEQVSADVRETQANLDKLRAGATTAEIRVAKAAVERATDQLSHARAQQARMKELMDQQAVTRGEFDDADAKATTAEHDLTEAQRRLDLLMVGTRREELDAARARLDGLLGRRQHLEEQVAGLDVVSPVTGIVATPSRQLHGLMRQFVSKGGLIAKVYEFHTVTAQIQIPEKEIADVSVGLRVELRTRALPNVTFDGTVVAVGVAAEGLPTADAASVAPASGKSSKTFIVTTQIANDALLLKPGMTGQAKIYCGERRILSLFTRRLVRTLNVEVWSWW